METKVMEIGNVKEPRPNFPRPEEGRVYAAAGIAPCIKADSQGHPKLVFIAYRKKK